MIAKPMKQQWVQILMSLAEKDLHGGEIQRAVLGSTDGNMKLWPAMLYRSLSKLELEGLIAQVQTPFEAPEDDRCQHYTLTDSGHGRLSEEIEMMKSWVESMREVRTN
jgi:DNA-binding PadR family transcriptional regulator